MKKFIFVYLTVILIIAGILFKDLVLSLVRGMGPLEIMKQIMTFMLHVTVITILGYVLVSFGEIVKNFVKFGRWVGRSLGRKRRRSVQRSSAPVRSTRRPGRLTATEKLLRLFIMAQQSEPPRSQQAPKSEDQSRLKFY